jgi:CBS domain-containing protein
VDKSQVREIMTDWGQVVTVTPDTTLLDCADLIVTRKIGCLPVLDGQGRAVGILTQKDVMAGLLDRARS